MVQALISINAVNGSNPPNGTALVINTLVNLDNVNTGGELTYLWEFLDRPEGSAAAFSNPAVQAPTFTPDVEGSYLIKLTVNRTLATEATNTVVAAVAQRRTNHRIPAAGETRETSTTRGWALAVNRLMKLVDTGLTQGGMLVGAAAAAMNRSAILRVTGVYTLNAGLPEERIIPEFSLALASSAIDASDELYIMEYTPDGLTAAAIGDLVTARSNGLFGPANGGVAVVGDPVYLNDVGAPSLLAGAIPRKIGYVVGLDGPDWYFHFMGAAGSSELTNEPLVFSQAPTGTYPNGVNLSALLSDLEIQAGADVLSLGLRRFSVGQASAVLSILTEGGTPISVFNANGDLVLSDPDGVGTRSISAPASDLEISADTDMILAAGLGGAVLFRINGTTVWQITTAGVLSAVGADRKIASVLDPVAAQDASTKAYTDGKDFTTFVFGNTDLPASADQCVLDPGFGVRTAKTVASAAWPSFRVTRAGTLQRLHGFVRNSSTVVATDVEVYVDSGTGYGATGIVITFSAGGVDEAKRDNTNVFVVASGDKVQLRSKPAGAPGVGCLDIMCSLELKPT